MFHILVQSAYRQLHSTETALLRVQNDIHQAVDSEGGAILVPLDLSADFDTIDHQKPLVLLDYSFGIRWDALRWFKSYLQDRPQTVQIGFSTSDPVTLKYGVPQGSVLGPILFAMYTTPLANIICNHSLDFLTFMLMIRNFIHHLSHVIQYLDRPPYHRLRPASRTPKHG